MTIDRSTLSPQNILDKYINPRIAFEPNTGCWFWLGYLQRGGYATVRLPHPDKGGWSTQYVARFLYEASADSLLQSLIVQNQCKMPGCVNPGHQRAVTKDEWMRGRTHWKRDIDRSRCFLGHELSDENTYVNYSGRKECRLCRHCRNKKYQEKKRAEDWRKFGEFLESLESSKHRLCGPNKYYVYHLIDPFTETVFYVGKGSGGRVFHHERDLLGGGLSTNSKKESFIRSIWNRGGEVRFSIVYRNLIEAKALWMEQQEIDRIGINNLTNRLSGTIPCKFRKLF